MNIEDIINSEALDKEACLYLRPFMGDAEEYTNLIAAILETQYVNADISNIIETNGLDKVIDFLNRFFRSELDFREKLKRGNKYDPWLAQEEDICSLTSEELEEFRSLAKKRQKVPIEELSLSAPVLTIKSFMDMCRIAYDAATLWDYPPDISTVFLYRQNKKEPINLKHGMFAGTDWNSPEEFAGYYQALYHPEELWFGGPDFYINDENYKQSEHCYGYTERYTKWTGSISNMGGKLSIYRGIKMFLALYKNGYPVYFGGYDRAYKEWLKIK